MEGCRGQGHGGPRGFVELGHQAEGMRPRPVFNKSKCRACNECVNCCPAKVIYIENKGGKKYAKVKLEGCIRCYCCQEVCMFKAVKIKKPWLNKIVVRNKSK